MTKPRQHDELTDEQIDAYAAEAEAGYNPDQLRPRFRAGHRGSAARVKASIERRAAERGNK